MEQTVLRQLAELPKMPFDGLKERWRALYGTEPPAYSRQHLVRRLAYRIQELAYGGLAEETKAKLEQIADEHDQARAKKRGKRQTNTPPAGTRLVRQWRGQRHIVTVTHDGGYEYGGKRYKSLSCVAKVITGAHRSGPLFFGLQRAGKDGRS
jgi:hypothetical protein